LRLSPGRGHPGERRCSLIITYSAMSKFLSCPAKYRFRYIQELVSREEDPVLWFGSAIHECLALFYHGVDLPEILTTLDARYSDRENNPEQKRDWQYTRAIMRNYARLFGIEPFVPTSPIPFDDPIIECPFEIQLADGVIFAGKADALVEMFQAVETPWGNLKPGYYLLEHKTSSNPSDLYWSQKWADQQTALYSWAVEREYGIVLNGVIYNVISKPKIRQTAGETAEEYQARCAELIAKSKSGKTSAKRKAAESDADFEARLDAWYQEPDRFQRRIIPHDPEIIADAILTITQTAEDIARASKTSYCRRSSGCMEYGKPCEYMPICRPGSDVGLYHSLYVNKKAHCELEGESNED